MGPRGRGGHQWVRMLQDSVCSLSIVITESYNVENHRESEDARRHEAVSNK